MHTLEQKKESIRLCKNKLRQELSHHSFKDVEVICSRLVEDPKYVLEMVPGILPVIQLCIGVTLGELLIEREEAEMQKEKV